MGRNGTIELDAEIRSQKFERKLHRYRYVNSHLQLSSALSLSRSFGLIQKNQKVKTQKSFST